MDQIQQLKDEIQRLRRAVEELSILNDLAGAIGASSDAEAIMHTIIGRSLLAVNAQQGVITLVDQKADDPMKTLVRAVSSASYEQFHLTHALLGWMHLNKKPLLLDSPRNDERFRGVQWDDSIKSLLCVPMMIRSELKGVLTVLNKKENKRFSEDDQRLLAIIAAQSAQVVENARLTEYEKQLMKMQEQLRLAAEIQTDLLPKEAPQIPGYDIAGKSIPAQTVGGDYFDFIPIADSHIAIALGDVTGKGLPASLLMANVQATLRGQALAHASAKDCVDRANSLLHQSTGAGKFVTLFYGILDYKNNTLTFSNAGHERPFLFRNERESIRLTTGGILLGTMESFPFEEEEIPLSESSTLVVFSDGITEAMNPDRQQFGEERIAEIIQANLNAPSSDIIERLITAAKTHAGAAPQSDDMTIVVVKRSRN